MSSLVVLIRMFCLVMQVHFHAPKSFYGELNPAENNTNRSYELRSKQASDNVKEIGLMMDDMLLPCLTKMSLVFGLIIRCHYGARMNGWQNSHVKAHDLDMTMSKSATF